MAFVNQEILMQNKLVEILQEVGWRNQKGAIEVRLSPKIVLEKIKSYNL